MHIYAKRPAENSFTGNLQQPFLKYCHTNGANVDEVKAYLNPSLYYTYTMGLLPDT